MIEVAAAIIENDQGQILIARKRPGKSQAGLWEFPGGKLEAGESPEACLKRELQEEMKIEIEPYACFESHDHHYGEVHIRLIAYKAYYIKGTIQLVDHDEFRWVERSELGAFVFAPADMKFVEMLVKEQKIVGEGNLAAQNILDKGALSDRKVTAAVDIKNDLKQAYNHQAEFRDTMELEDWKVEERKKVLQAFRASRIHNVLEIGAGPGRDSLYFQQHGLDVTAIDMSEEMVRLCQQKGLHAIVMDLYQLKFADEVFDAVYAMNCLLHVPKSQIADVLAEIRRVMKPDGLLYLGLYGGISVDGVWEQDTYEPKRYFAMYPDEEILRIVLDYFQVEDFHTRFMGEGKPHFQAIRLRK
ncbi:8-oxo-dGTP diphosphatase MutT [Paenibacillus faecalis]|uniref:8-oxo-dGTP diphosphatase MutT n=1 Tax=Paenibacillus faecalis TaxID=2079532 RepID=UPI000D10FB96|nr:8-oxo-dGTP diphosphatase MutT [Paenibacillus faecalis]